MKKIRLAAMAVVLVASSVAVSKAHYQSLKNGQTWHFTGIAGEEDNATKYQLAADPNIPCGGSGIICTITAEADGDQPLLNSENPVSESNPDYQPITLRQE